MKLRIQTNRYFSSISEFSFIKDIGVGSFGTVRLALHTHTNQCYAIKVVHPSPLRSTSKAASQKTNFSSSKDRSTCTPTSTTLTSSNSGIHSSTTIPCIWSWNWPKMEPFSATKTKIEISVKQKHSNFLVKPYQHCNTCIATISCTEISK